MNLNTSEHASIQARLDFLDDTKFIKYLQTFYESFSFIGGILKEIEYNDLYNQTETLMKILVLPKWFDITKKDSKFK